MSSATTCAHSPDLDLIEHPCKIMYRCKHHHQVPPQISPITEVLIQVWEEIFQGVSCRLIRSMFRHSWECIQARGAPHTWHTSESHYELPLWNSCKVDEPVISAFHLCEQAHKEWVITRENCFCHLLPSFILLKQLRRRRQMCWYENLWWAFFT